ncbi:class I SAM-dependent methyltransferase [Rugamonas sp. DEMB1]|uniref:class I SAM-dependent methyltransferase n=1 Tax=Rugamonas sp. DEMB1 TaxID=3039386 RepID=UPI002449F1BD|nr:class I SAM-dependent methyltransferase [Rugamonas sp. DEMB1]WGG51384.1 class I SAM-dependent methyltransferase [Rugamonas sp. DEMB1]
MSEWSAGYVSDIGYTFGYYTELNPMRIKLGFLHAGKVFPEVGHACELGFGQGLSANIHAAASVVEWHGTDFNPAQAGFAQELAAASGANVHLRDQSFAEFCQREGHCPTSTASACTASGAGSPTRTAPSSSTSSAAS